MIPKITAAIGPTHPTNGSMIINPASVPAVRHMPFDACALPVLPFSPACAHETSNQVPALTDIAYIVTVNVLIVMPSTLAGYPTF